ncbi:MAG: hypothetical protein A3I05_02865 [Deltaproteobacteria bacterium RIFCSPLOWO2_02_FULL_44_10]|nr:MAG: hypothetical protein A3I05_02865 [Deltaproteobacteria bacterium RIFCSPLOWO2_02_FULL_44_10]
MTFLGCGGATTTPGDPLGTTTSAVGSLGTATAVGSLQVNVHPTSATVVMTGPESFTQTFTGNQLFTNLVPGLYGVTATAPAFSDAVGQINVAAGQISSISLILASTSLAMSAGVSESTVGSLNINVYPSSATVVVTGPDGFTQTFTGNQLLIDLAPGQYVATATAPAFGDAVGQINVVAGNTSSLSLVLIATPIISEAPRAVYRNDQGNLIPIDSSTLQSGRFVFYAWEQDKPNGIVPANLTSSMVSDPGRPLAIEQMETAPSFTQNLAVAWVGFTDSTGVVRPVIGADVRWEIDQWWFGRVNSMQFGTSDDNRVALGYGIFDDQADTRTNNARLTAERFPLIGTEYPLYNQSGIGTPFVDGFTWVTLFSPDARSEARITAVATINGEEIGKQIFYKKFAPAPELEITKTVNSDIVHLVGGVASATWTVTIQNVGNGDATNIDLSDILSSGAEASYSLNSRPAGSTAVGDGFTYSFALPSQLAPAGDNTQILTFTATVTAPGTYCNKSQILLYRDSDNSWAPVDLSAEACFTALESNVSIIKDFVAADDVTSLGESMTVSANMPARLRVRVINSGTGSATGVMVHDELTSGDMAPFQINSISSGTLNSSDGFDNNIGDLAAGSTSTMLFTVQASVDGIYCDTASLSATSGTIGIGSDIACLTVATPNLEITKVNAPESVIPSASYTSTIVVQNSGSAPAQNVVISDVLGLNSAANVQVIYVSSNLNGAVGALSGNVVTSPSTMNVLAGESLTFIVVSRIPFGAASGIYCDTATVTSSNAASVQASDCVNVPAFSALQTQLVDLSDPIAVNSNVTYFSVLYVESLSNEGVNSNRLKYSFGLVSPTVLGIPGLFQAVSTRIYLDTAPVRDPATGSIVSDASSPTAVLLTAGSDYTVNDSTAGLQLIDMTSSVVLQPNTALYVVHETLIPSGTTTNRLYTTSYIWDSVGLVDPMNTYQASASEPTTVLP